MAFADDVKTDFDNMLSDGEFADSIRYKHAAAPWVSISAFVTEGGLDATELIGFVAESGQEPILVQVSKTDIPNVQERTDIVEWNGRSYYVKRVLSEDAGSRRLYCVK